MTAIKTGKFPASFKLKSEKRIDLLFKKGKSYFKFPIKIQYQISDEEEDTPSGFQIGVSVSKKRFKKAVDRNLLKRRMRESIRGTVTTLSDISMTRKLNVSVMAIFVGNSLEGFEIIDKAMKSVIHKLQKEIVSREAR